MSAPLRPSDEVAALADDLDTVLFRGEHDPARAERVDAALVAGLDGIEWLLGSQADDVRSTPTGIEVARAAFDLIVDVRRGRMPRSFARLAAGATFLHVGARTEMHPEAEPLLRVLAALAALPTDSREGPSLEVAADPGSTIEQAIAVARRDPVARLALLDVLREEELQLPVLGVAVGGASARRRAEVRFLPVVVAGRPAIAAYTSTARIEEHARDAGVGEVPAMRLRGADLGRVVPAGHGLILNPGSLLGMGFTAAEVAGLGDQRSGQL